MNLITSTSALSDAVAALSKSDFVAVDTEFIRETTFWPELCLIQMASPDFEALVDPLAPGIDLRPFFALMADEKITKVFHAARQDVEIVYNLGQLIPSPMFDSQVAAMVCGYGESISYDQLVNKMTGVHLDKTSRFTDWRRRPLADTQLTYALADVTHLAAIYPILRGQLAEKGRVDWVKDEMSTLTSVETYDIHPDDAWKRLKMRARRPIELATLQKIAAWREREARDRNVPRSRVMKDDTLFEVAQQQPDSVEALGKLRSVPNGWERSQPAQGLVAAVNEALAIPKEDLPKLAKHVQGPEGSAAAGELLRVLLKIITEEHGVASKVVASADELDKIAAHGDKADVQVLHGWRRELFGEMALKLIAGEVALKFEDRKVKAVAV
jgi:ribonuclease D